MDINVKEFIRSLPFNQQVALWLITQMPRAEKENFSFYSSDFTKKLLPYLKKEFATDPGESGKFAGAILSGLARNNLLEKITGDKDKLWTLSKIVKDHYSDIKQNLFEVKTYWG